MILPVRLALLCLCVLSLISFAAAKRAQEFAHASPLTKKTAAADTLARPKLSGSQEKSGARKVTDKGAVTVREIDVAGLKKLLERDSQKPRPLLVNFWATWCEPCRAEFPDLVQIDTEYRSRGLDFIAVSIDEVTEIKTTVPKFLEEMRAKMPAYLLNTPEPEVAIMAVDPQWSGSLPATFLFDAQGKMVFKHLGRIKPNELRAAVNKVMSGK